MSRIHALICAALLVPQQLFADEPAQNQALTPPPAVISAESMLQLLAGLLAVLALIALIAWVFKKIGFHPAGKPGPLKIIASAGVGQKERIVLVEIEGTRLVLGVAPGHVSLLHRMYKKPVTADVATDSALGSSFPEKLQANLEQNHEA